MHSKFVSTYFWSTTTVRDDKQSMDSIDLCQSGHSFSSRYMLNYSRHSAIIIDILP